MSRDKLALVFPGQASQEVGMGIELSAESPHARAVLDSAEAVTSVPLQKLFADGPLEELTRTTVAQPGVVTVSLMALAALEERIGSPLEPMVGACAGHSVGEYAALVAARVMDGEEALELVCHRARVMEDACEDVKGTMAAVIGLAAAEVTAICERATQESDSAVEVANFNAPEQVVISGARDAVQAASELARQAGARRVVQLNVSGPFHSRYMQPAAQTFAPFVARARLAPPRFPIVLNQTAQATTDPDEIRRELVEQLYSPVRWVDSLQSMAALGCARFVELGPGKVLSALGKRTVEGEFLAVQDAKSLNDVAALLEPRGEIG